VGTEEKYAWKNNNTKKEEWKMKERILRNKLKGGDAGV